MAHILKKALLNDRFWGILFLFGCFSCQNKEQKKQYEGQRANVFRHDTSPVIVKENKRNRESITTIFTKIPNAFFQSSLFPALTQAEKANLLVSAPNMKDMVIDTLNHYIFFDRETKDKNKGILTTIKAFPMNDGAELVVVETSKWSDENTETEEVKCLKIFKNGEQVELSMYNIFPEIQLQDFFKEDITTKIPAPDHNSMPALIYEIQRNKASIYMFLGEWKHSKEVFSYKSDIDFVELRWEDNHFVKIGK